MNSVDHKQPPPGEGGKPTVIKISFTGENAEVKVDMDEHHVGHGGHGGELDNTIKENHDILLNTLEVNSAFLIALCSEGLLDLSEAYRIQKSGDQVKDLLRLLEEKNDRGAVGHFLRALEKSGQLDLTIRLTSYDREMRYVGKWHSKLACEIEAFIDRLVTQERRLGMKSDPRKLKLDEPDARDTLSLLRSAKSLLMETCTQIGRSSAVLSKLQHDRSTVTTKATDNLARLQECEGLFRAAFPEEARRVGRSKALMKLNDESDRIMRSVRDIVKECQNSYEKQRHLTADCSMTIERLSHLVKNRVSAIEKTSVSVSPKPTPRSLADTPRKNIHRHSQEGVGYLLEELDSLEKELQKYMTQEKSTLHKLNAMNLQLRLTKIHLDPEDKDLKALEKEVNAANKQSTLVIIRTLMARVHKEKREALASLAEIEKLVDGRIALIEKREGKTSPAASPKQKKDQTHHGDKDNLPWRAKHVLEKVKAYSDVEKGISTQHLADFAKKRRALTDEMTAMQNDIELLEEMAKRFEGEKEKYKRLYDTERVIKHKDTSKKKEDSKVSSRGQRRVRPVWNSHLSLEQKDQHHRRPLPATFNQYLSEKGQLKHESRSSWEKPMNGQPEKKVEKSDKKPNKCATS
ncbi:uncharacterized protein LOC135487014 [Lineus longissimus]|uniref:uncharacterized protein LOC135487014 n=1 Tax=Lineus longissimus TaxID=88925 RepID=UPI00315DFCC3